MPRETIQVRRNVHVRYQGTDTALIVLCADMRRSGATSKPRIVEPGDVFVIETPGGGGYGVPE